MSQSDRGYLCVCVCVCMCVCVCVCVSRYIYTYPYIYAYIHIYVYICLYIYVCIHTYIYSYRRATVGGPRAPSAKSKRRKATGVLTKINKKIKRKKKKKPCFRWKISYEKKPARRSFMASIFMPLKISPDKLKCIPKDSTCAHAYVYVYTYACSKVASTDTRMHTYTHTRSQRAPPVHTYVYVYTCMCMCTHAHTRVCICVHIRACNKVTSTTECVPLLQNEFSCYSMCMCTHTHVARWQVQTHAFLSGLWYASVSKETYYKTKETYDGSGVRACL